MVSYSQESFFLKEKRGTEVDGIREVWEGIG